VSQRGIRKDGTIEDRRTLQGKTKVKDAEVQGRAVTLASEKKNSFGLFMRAEEIGGVGRFHYS